ncbi:transporter substrate-binding domain-containing protein [Paracoccus sp. S1E-3]|uniref:transporter substrate-binding domain-containing protein n=1 Tax=Paracoccus sp. S1E-3 TaxID=2756130 RepID=UPI0015EF5A58|nr:transporter substrate-binding domain-containing protein [Paracoccus sp. S1E-3]MBA4491485.1 transporter substrate-binding domain-containing protein [Paracoccus sp. S1E-3]
MKLPTFAMGMLAGIAIASGALAQETIRIATEGAYPPFNYVDASGKLGGFDVDIANALCEAAKLQCEIVAQDWDGIIPGLLAEKYDAIIASMTMTPERAAVVAFTDKYAQVPVRFVVSNELADQIDSTPGEGIEQQKTALAGKTVGLVAATAAEPYVRDTFGDTVTYRGYQKMDDAIQDLIAGRIDAYADGAVPIENLFLSRDEGKGFRFGGDAFSDPTYFGTGNGIAVRKDDPELLEKLNTALAQIRADGTYAKINDKYFSFDIYGE